MHLFVYGTLLSSIPSSMSKFLSRRATLVGAARAPGRLFDLGMYPGYVADGAGEVLGELYHLHPEGEETTWEMLDAYESVTGEAEDEYRREEIRVRTTEGEEYAADTYVFTGEHQQKAVIPNGDYRAFYAGSAEHQRFVNGG